MNRVPMNSYAQSHADFEWMVPEQFNFGSDVVDYWANDPDRLALIWTNDQGDDRRLTYAQIRDRSNQFANLLASRRAIG
jgi:acyl-coenzyme A synthetase/AMP-(fatty) acid ligase